MPNTKLSKLTKKTFVINRQFKIKEIEITEFSDNSLQILLNGITCMSYSKNEIRYICGELYKRLKYYENGVY